MGSLLLSFFKVEGVEKWTYGLRCDREGEEGRGRRRAYCRYKRNQMKNLFYPTTPNRLRQKKKKDENTKQIKSRQTYKEKAKQNCVTNNIY